MKLTAFSSFIPVLSALALLATPTTGWADRKFTVYRDNDGDGHYNKKKIEVPSRRYYDSHHRSYPRYYSHSPSYYGRPYYGRSYGPSVSLNFQRSPSYRSNYSDDLAVDVQRELRRRGYYRGSLDGDVGPGTRSAIRAYQYDRGLATTGRIDTSLLRALGIG